MCPDRTVPAPAEWSRLPVAAKHVPAVMIEVTLTLQSLLQSGAAAVNPDLRCRNGAPDHLSNLFGTQTFEVMEHQGCSVVFGQTVNDSSQAAVHLVDDEPVVNCGNSISDFTRFIDANNLRPVNGITKVVCGDPRSDGESPRLHAGAPGKPGQAAGDPDHRFLKEIIGERGVADIS